MPGGRAPLPQQYPPSRRTKIVIAAVVVLVVAAAGGVAWSVSSHHGDGHVHSDNDRQSGATASPLSGESVPPPGPPAPPSGDQRPPSDDLLSSLEHEPDKPRWAYSGGKNTALIGGGEHVLVVGTDQGIVALDAATGTPRWQHPVVPQPVGLSSRIYATCVLNRAETTIGCTFGSGKNIPIVFFDVETGTQKFSTIGSSPIYPAGSGFVTETGGLVTGYRSDGTESWKGDPRVPPGESLMAKVYGDQGIVMLGHGGVMYDVVDADTGRGILHLGEGAGMRDGLAFAGGFVLSDRITIDFYDFTGKKTASVPARGYELIRYYKSPAEYYWQTSRGFQYPLAYSTAPDGEIRAFDGTDGHVIWTVQTGKEFAQAPQAFASGQTCFIYTGLPPKNVAMMIQKCGADAQSGNTFKDLGTGDPTFFYGSDGQRVLVPLRGDWGEHDEGLGCVDVTTGQPVWEMLDDAVNPKWVGSGLYTQGYFTVDANSLIRWL